MSPTGSFFCYFDRGEQVADYYYWWLLIAVATGCCRNGIYSTPGENGPVRGHFFRFLPQLAFQGWVCFPILGALLGALQLQVNAREDLLDAVRIARVQVGLQHRFQGRETPRLLPQFPPFGARLFQLQRLRK